MPDLLQLIMGNNPKLLILFIPTIIIWLITKFTKSHNSSAKFIVLAIILSETVNYLQWRLLSTLNFSSILNATFSILTLSLEIIIICHASIKLWLMVKLKDERHLINSSAIAVETNKFKPTVDIFIPTYNEPEFILKRTIVGCKNIDYEPKQIYVLDDTNRSSIKELTTKLGCNYLASEDNHFAKAGNINQALAKTSGELIAFFDADFIPTNNFLTRTVGMFAKGKTGLVQTPQCFYNSDPIARNLGLEKILTPEEEVFYRQLQPIKNAVEAPVCAGTSFVASREALDHIGGFVTTSLSEDYFTGIEISAAGWKTIYINEKLSAGLAAESIADHVKQRLRWARGTLQGFYISSNPLTIPGLKPVQRLSHFEGLTHWGVGLLNAILLIIPIAIAFLQINPILTTPKEVICYLLPYYLSYIFSYAWLNKYSRSIFLSNVYGLILTFPQAITVIQTLIAPFSRGFDVTPKGIKRDRSYYHWKLAAPLIVLFVLTSFALWQIAREAQAYKLPIVWNLINLVSIGCALACLLDPPQEQQNTWFDARGNIRANIQKDELNGYLAIVKEVSLQGLKVQTAADPSHLDTPEGGKVKIDIFNFQVEAHVTKRVTDKFNKLDLITVEFDQLNLEQEKILIKELYCQPGQWKDKHSPGELYSLWLMTKTLATKILSIV